ncbi:MAG: PIN domain-containing protein [Treponemataceae bacterium]|nr:PIN domain-containing protein [Spirochaetales bacterium]MDY6031037.1 PIN domain-containing protein [Treponemataceae bacterium]
MRAIYLLDTNIISELARPEPNKNVVRKIFENQKVSSLSSVTWAEALFSVKRMPQGKRKDLFFDFYINTVQNVYEFFDFDIHAASVYSDIKTRLEHIGKIPQELDLQIASVAIANNLILITRNVNDFTDIAENSALMMENWFE